MASFAHIAVGMTAGRLYSARRGGVVWKAMVGMSALSLLPDADVWAFKMGIPYEDPFGHRGASHSIVFALVTGVVTALLLARPRLWTFGLAALVVLSHPLLDALTDGGLGVALFWPFDVTRYFAPWQPIPVAPIGAGLVSARGFYVLAVELAATAPLVVWALWPRGKRAVVAG